MITYILSICLLTNAEYINPNMELISNDNCEYLGLCKNAYVQTDIEPNISHCDMMSHSFECCVTTPLGNQMDRKSTNNASSSPNQNNKPQSSNKHQDDSRNDDNVGSNGGSGYNGNGGNRGNDNNDDGRGNKRTDVEVAQEGDEDEEEDDDDEKEEKNSKCTGSTAYTLLNPNATEWDNFEFEVKMKTIHETRPLKEASLKFFDPVGPAKIKISRKLTEDIVPHVAESFYNIYDFMNKSLVFQSIKRIFHDNTCVINYGFHDASTAESLYCIANKSNTTKMTTKTKYKWIMREALFTAHQIQQQLNITHNTLPESIASDPHFAAQIQQFEANATLTSTMVQHILQQSKWHNIPVHTKRNYKERKSLFLSQNQFKKRIQQFHDTNTKDIQFIPIVRINNKAHYWVEHVLIVHIQDNMTIGIALQYDMTKKRIKVTGIHLNQSYLRKSHQLIPSPHDCKCLDSFESFYDDLVIGNMDLRKEIVRLQTENQHLKERNEELDDQASSDVNVDYYKTKYHQFKQFIQRFQSSSNDQHDVLVREASELLQTATTPVSDDHVVAHVAPLDSNPVPQPVERIEHALSISTTALTDSTHNDMPPMNPDKLHILSRSLPNISQTISEDSSTPIIPSISNVLFIQPPYFSSYSIQSLPQLFPIIQPFASTALYAIPFPPDTNMIMHPQPPTLMWSPSDRSLNQTHAVNVPITSYTRFSPTHGTNSVFIDKSITEHYISDTPYKTIFKDAKHLYYYLKQSICMQINDGFAREYVTHERTLAIAHCDLYYKTPVYVIMEPFHPRNPHAKLEWQMVSLSTHHEIALHYHLNIERDQLPSSSRGTPAFTQQLNQEPYIMGKIGESIHNVRVRNTRQVKSKSRNGCEQSAKQTIEISEEGIKQCVSRSVYKGDPAIPIVKIKNDQHWVEWIVICEVPSKRIHFGVSFRDCKGKVDATSLFLDASEIERQNQLIGIRPHADLSEFVSGISQLVITNKKKVK